MSELKAMKFFEAVPTRKEGFYQPGAFVDGYLKSEADKVIAEKDKEIAELKEQVHDYAQGLYVMQARAEIELRHQKYKRCLAMASECRLRARWFGDNAFYKKEQWALQWHRRWLELAEKFKEVK